MNTAEFLTISAAIVPERIALATKNEKVSYAQLQSRVNKMANSLSLLDVKKGQNVGVMTVNCIEMVELYYATAMLGATFVPLNFRSKPEELEYMISAADVSVLFVGERYLSVYESIRNNLPSIKHLITVDFEAENYNSYKNLADKGVDLPIYTEIDDEDATLIIYTSGTTSLPKGVILSYKALTALVVNTQSPADPVSNQEVILVSVGFYHIAGATTLMSAIFSGRQLVLLDGFSPDEWLDAVENNHVTHAFVVPTMLKRIMEVENFKDRDFSDLKLITYGAAPMPYDVVKDAVELFAPDKADVGLMNAYGQTEATGSMTFLGPDDHRIDGNVEENKTKWVRLRSVGKPMPDIEIGILDHSGKILHAGENGEICIRGERIMKGYKGRDDETVDAIKDGWLHTGDVGRLDKENYLFITGRIKDMIIRGGENIAPAEIEQVLEEHSDISEAAVIGVEDNEWGEVVKAIVVNSSGKKPNYDELTVFVKNKLASYKSPASYEWVDELPKNHMGKVLKNDLRELFSK
ncbi:MAG: AMP-binding protein [Dehalococcoidia bacterium]|jgi:acyl-CoA synthetase (AMP-forming)/AMP-acid ligase II|nr:MAG: Acyl-CoA synthetase (AMP-forming)/AMP-acid ligase II [Chloroflexota bacterium]|tara:strand:- start:8 stop:1573 length:1566 start_codon:yes stop_codon:yes gene_type:complete